MTHRNNRGPDPRTKVEQHFGESFDLLLQLNGGSTNGAAVVSVMELLKKFISRNKGGITTTQLRNIYAIALQLSTGDPSTYAKLKYKLAYIAGRQKKSTDTELFTSFIDKLLDETSKKGDQERAIDNFKMVMEAIVAYHRYFNPKEN